MTTCHNHDRLSEVALEVASLIESGRDTHNQDTAYHTLEIARRRALSLVESLESLEKGDSA